MLNTYLQFTNSMAPVYSSVITKSERPPALLGPTVGLCLYFTMQDPEASLKTSTSMALYLSAFLARYIVPLHLLEQLVSLRMIYLVKAKLEQLIAKVPAEERGDAPTPSLDKALPFYLRGETSLTLTLKMVGAALFYFARALIAIAFAFHTAVAMLLTFTSDFVTGVRSFVHGRATANDEAAKTYSIEGHSYCSFLCVISSVFYRFVELLSLLASFVLAPISMGAKIAAYVQGTHQDPTSWQARSAYWAVRILSVFAAIAIAYIFTVVVPVIPLLMGVLAASKVFGAVVTILSLGLNHVAFFGVIKDLVSAAVYGLMPMIFKTFSSTVVHEESAAALALTVMYDVNDERQSLVETQIRRQAKENAADKQPEDSESIDPSVGLNDGENDDYNSTSSSQRLDWVEDAEDDAEDDGHGSNFSR